MGPFDLREPVSAWTHAIGMAAAFPTTWLLIRQALKTPANDPASARWRAGKILALAVFGLGMAACYGASATYHGAHGDPHRIDVLRRFDLVGIFLLIAGTFTPAAYVLMPRWSRRPATAVVWGVSAVCATAVAIGRPFPTWLATLIYLSIGWGMLICYRQIRRLHDPKTLRMLPLGGLLYTLGAVLNLAHLPDLIPGLGGHEVFHLFVLAGTASHIAFLFQTAVTAGPVPDDRVSLASLNKAESAVRPPHLSSVSRRRSLLVRGSR